MPRFPHTIYPSLLRITVFLLVSLAFCTFGICLLLIEPANDPHPIEAILVRFIFGPFFFLFGLCLSLLIIYIYFKIAIVVFDEDGVTLPPRNYRITIPWDAIINVNIVNGSKFSEWLDQEVIFTTSRQYEFNQVGEANWIYNWFAQRSPKDSSIFKPIVYPVYRDKDGNGLIHITFYLGSPKNLKLVKEIIETMIEKKQSTDF